LKNLAIESSTGTLLQIPKHTLIQRSIVIRQSKRDEYQSNAKSPRKILNVMIAMLGENVPDKDDRLIMPVGKPLKVLHGDLLPGSTTGCPPPSAVTLGSSEVTEKKGACIVCSK
jgi:hypothetical protein